MNLDQLRAWALAQGQVAKTDGTYPGQCVSLINQYLSKVFSIQAGAWGDAKDWATNGSVASYFDKVGSPQAGDIGVSGAVPGNPYGHIWIYLSPTQVLEQNGSIPGRVSVRPAYTNPIAILRRKGTSMATDIWGALDQSNKDRDKLIGELKAEISKLYIALDSTNKRLDALVKNQTTGSLDGLYEIKKK